jgi:ribosomal protein RSM22 (predicted rRNA methylase)
VPSQCPHDGACPLHHGGTERLVCGFSQRLQRPAFLRRTKHTKVGHEDIGYSYVVVRRGARPPPLAKNAPRLGRLGQVGSRALQREAEKLAEAARPKVLEESVAQATAVAEPSTVADAGAAEPAASMPASADEPKDGVLESLRQEAFRWPRLVFPPLKRSGHIILDVCAPEGAAPFRLPTAHAC